MTAWNQNQGSHPKLVGLLPAGGKAKRNIVRTDRTDIKRIMVFGDSNAFRPASNKKTWPKLLEAKDPRYLNVFNESCDGRTTRYDTGECNGLSVIAEKLTAHKPLDYVVVVLGTNDVKNKYGPPRPAKITEGISRILEIIENHGGGAKPILLTPPPLGNVNSGELAGAQPRIPSVAVEYRRLSRNRNTRLIDIYSILEVSKDLESDLIHLNAVGKKKVAKAVWANLQEVNPPSRIKRRPSMFA
jgi:lysophospholipase L1-like esterase